MIIVFVLYLVLLMVITIWTARMSKCSDDYIAGGKRIGGVSMALSERATGESAWLILGLTGEAYLLGLHALWFALGCVIGIKDRPVYDPYERVCVEGPVFDAQEIDWGRLEASRDHQPGGTSAGSDCCCAPRGKG